MAQTGVEPLDRINLRNSDAACPEGIPPKFDPLTFAHEAIVALHKPPYGVHTTNTRSIHVQAPDKPSVVI